MAEELLDETISADDFRKAFLEWLNDDTAELPKHKTIDGDLDLGGLAVDKMLTLTDRVFTGYLGLYDMQFARSVNLRGCTIHGAFNMSDAVVEGSLNIDDATIGCQKSFADEVVTEAHEWLATVPESESVAGLRQSLPRTVTGLRDLIGKMPGYFAGLDETKESEALKWWEARPPAVKRWLKNTLAAWLDNLQVRGYATFERTVFCGSVSISSIRTGGNLNFGRSRIRGWLTGVGLSSGGRFGLYQATIEGNCNLESAESKGHVVLRNAVLESALNLCSLRCETSVLAEGLQCHDLDLEDLKAEDSLLFSAANIAGTLKARSMRIGGRANFNSTDSGQTRIHSWAVFANSECALGLTMEGASIAGALDLRELHAKFVDLNATSNHCTRIGGFLTLNDAEVIGDVRMRGTQVAGDGHFGQAKFGAFFFSPAVVQESADTWRLALPRIRSIHAIGLEVRGLTALIGTQVAASDDAKNVSTEDGWVDFRMARLGGLFTWSRQFIDEAAASAGNNGTANPVVDARHEDIGMSATQLRLDGSSSAFIHLDNARIAADRRAPDSRNAGLASLADCRIQDDLTWMNHTGDLDMVGCNRLDATALRCEGDVDLSGVLTTVQPDTNEKAPVAVKLRDARVHGQLRFHTSAAERDAASARARDSEALTAHPAENMDIAHAAAGAETETNAIRNDEATHASLSGALQLDAASIGHLIISGDSFDQLDRTCTEPRPFWHEFIQLLSCNLACRPDHPTDPDAIVSLERATIRRLEVRDPLPATVDLTRVTVERWELPPPSDEIAEDMSQEERIAFPYLKLLACASPFKRSNYATIDRSLRDRGENAASDAVFRAMKFELLRRERRWLRQLGGLLHAFIGFGTRWKAMVLMLVALALASIGIFAFDDGIEIRPEVQGALVEGGQDPTTARWDPGQWSLSRRLGAAAALTLRYHAPLISLPAFEGFRAGPGAPMVWATAMAALHWVLLPLILSSLIPSIIRRRDEA